MRFIKVKKIDRKTKAEIGWRYEFRAYNPTTRRNEPVPRDQLPEHIQNCTSDEVAEAYCKSRDAEDDAVKHRAKKRLDWKKKYADFDKLLTKFEGWQKKNAPNSYENDVYYLERYAFHFFLDQKESHNNILNWSLYYDEFKTWLQTVKPLKWNKENLSLNTQNKVIKALNKFLEMVGKENDKQFTKCPQYKRHELPKVSAQELLTEEDIKQIQYQLKGISKDSHDMFTVLVRTGMRENEGAGIAQAFVFDGHIDGTKSKKIHRQIEVSELPDYFGYICLESQPDRSPARIVKPFKDRFGETWAEGTVPRKPLKLRKEIAPEHFRFIPIFDKQAWNIIVERYNDQTEKFEKRVHGKNPRDYLLFEDFSLGVFYNHLVKAFGQAKLEFRSPHKLRHTYLTWFYDKTNEDRFLAKKVAGHAEERSMEIYSHMSEQIGLEQKQKTQTKKRLKAV